MKHERNPSSRSHSSHWLQGPKGRAPKNVPENDLGCRSNANACPLWRGATRHASGEACHFFTFNGQVAPLSREVSGRGSPEPQPGLKPSTILHRRYATFGRNASWLPSPARSNPGLRSCLLLLLTALLGLGLGLPAANAAENATFYNNAGKAFLKQHCFSCHGPEKQKGKLRLDTLGLDFLDSETAEKWTEVMDNINLDEMPPEDEPRPNAKEAAALASWIAAELRHAHKAGNSTGGRVLMRRLNRREYANTVRDLLQLEFLPNEGPRDLLPPDGTLDGFDNVSRALLLDPSLMQQYFDVAARIADKAIVLGPPPVPTRTNRMQYEEMSGGIEYIRKHKTTIETEDGVITMQQGMRSDDKLKHPWNNKLIPVRGQYRIRLRVGADPGERGEPLIIRVKRTGDPDLFVGKVPGTLAAPEIIEIERAFDTPGGDEIGVEFVNAPKWSAANYTYNELRKQADEASKSGRLKEAGRRKAQMVAQGNLSQSRPAPETLHPEGLPRIYFDWIEMTGPIYEQWPPASTGAVFFKGLEPQMFGEEYARQIVERILPRAYRRPVTDEEVRAITGIIQAEREASESFPEAVKAGLIGILCSPKFLLVHEPAAADSKRELNDYELATRLSLFLWSSMPDQRLTSLAGSGKLRDKATRLAEVDRMLTDPKSQALIDGFATQWLRAHEFDRFAVDRNLYRDYHAPNNAGLNEAINREPIAFFTELLRKDGSLLDLLSCDWTMANDLLARHYDLEGSAATGADFVKVKLPPESRRGGLVTMAAVHKWGSDGNRTKPVERGKYILEVLFNDPPDPPPPNVGEVEPNVDGEKLTVRERLDQHRSIESCAACHKRIDPYGLALENFNVVGSWREKQDGERPWWPDEAKIDATGTLPNGRAFNNPDEFRAALRDQGDRFLRGFVEKMMTYALGRGHEASDRVMIDELVAEMKRNGESPRSLIKGLVVSDAFGEK